MEDSPYPSDFTEVADSTSEQTDLRPYSPTDQAAEFPDSFVHHDQPRSVHEDEPTLGQDGGYNSSASSTQHDMPGADLDDEELSGLNSRASSRSSVSSLPASILTNAMENLKSTIAPETHKHNLCRHWDDHYGRGQEKMDGLLKPIHNVRHRDNAFRKPSSVRAMQMHTEDEGDDEYMTPPKRRGHRISDISMRSSNSSPLKRSPYYSPTGSASKQRAKKEFPLVLLHCNLLPPSLPVPGLMGIPDQKILKEVLPSEHWRRWKLLEEKVGSGVLRDRGVLISHPEDMYDLLEERLLESLELQRPRFDHGHFVGHEEADSEKEDQSREESETDGEQGEECLDCGARVLRHNNVGRKWEIKVFAANGLMRAGAWAAAWKEMEKVDVEVGLWLPSDVRRELEKRLLDDETSHSRNRIAVPLLHEPDSTELHSRSLCEQTPIQSNAMPVLFVPEKAERLSSHVPEKLTPREPQYHDHPPVQSRRPEVEIDLQTLLFNYIRVLASDRRNIAIVLLSILVAFLAIGTKPNAPASDLQPFPQDVMDSVSQPTMYSMPSPPDHRSTTTDPDVRLLETLESSIAPTMSSAKLQASSSRLSSSTSSATTIETEETNESLVDPPSPSSSVASKTAAETEEKKDPLIEPPSLSSSVASATITQKEEPTASPSSSVASATAIETEQASESPADPPSISSSVASSTLAETQETNESSVVDHPIPESAMNGISSMESEPSILAQSENVAIDPVMELAADLAESADLVDPLSETLENVNDGEESLIVI